jgi:AcrR family transcriptional regulator
MARPVDADPEKTRRRLLEAALALFAARGFAGTSTRELAARARVNPAMLSHYFGGKQGLHDAAVDEVYRRLAARVLPLVAGERRRPDLGALLGAIYDAGRAERDGVRLLMRQVLDHGRLGRHAEEVYYLPGTRRYAAHLARAFDVPPARARLALVTLMFLVTRFVLQDDASLRAALGATSARTSRAAVVVSLIATARALLET